MLESLDSGRLLWQRVIVSVTKSHIELIYNSVSTIHHLPSP